MVTEVPGCDILSRPSGDGPPITAARSQNQGSDSIEVVAVEEPSVDLGPITRPRFG